MQKAFYYIALIGWALVLMVHIAALSGIDVTDTFPFVWLLVLGMFAVWLPAVLHLKNDEAVRDFQQSGFVNRMNPVAFYKIIFKDTPMWLRTVAMASFFYSFINFALFMASYRGMPQLKDGHYILQEHGQFIKNLTVTEYHHYKANEVRGYSGHLMMFYSMAAAILYPFGREEMGEV